MARQLDFYFSAGSTYTYLTVMRIDALAAAAGVTVRWLPFSVRTIMLEQNNRPFVGKPVKTQYMWRDLERRAARHGITFSGAPRYPNDGDPLTNVLGIVAADQGWCSALMQRVYRDWFLRDRDPGDRQNLSRILDELGQDPDSLLALAESPAMQARYAVQTDVARRAGIFGSPSFLVGDELFWGDDRLEDALEWCQRKSVEHPSST